MVDWSLQSKIGNARIIREVDRLSIRGLMLSLWALFSIAVVLIWCCTAYRTIREYNYKIEELKRQREALLAVQRKLTVERALLCSPQRIHEYAERTLGLTYPASRQVIFCDRPEIGAHKVNRPEDAASVERLTLSLQAFDAQGSNVQRDPASKGFQNARQ